jgi:catechol 2,3-dioxygenase-like lactoylglutathione lyase family enzyme
MHLTAIRTLYLAVPEPEVAASAYERLGLNALTRRDGYCIPIGGPTNLVEIRLVADPSRVGLFAVGVECTDLPGLLAACDRHRIAYSRSIDEDGPSARLHLHDAAGAELIVRTSSPHVHQRHAFPLSRLDHLASIAPDLAGPSHVWTDLLGVPVVGEVHVADPLMTVRQFGIGDAIFELLGDPTDDGPLRKRPSGLLSMASWEVADLDAAVRQARAAGFTAGDPAVGALPGTRIATIPGEELAGLRMQLLQYTLDKAA